MDSITIKRRQWKKKNQLILPKLLDLQGIYCRNKKVRNQFCLVNIQVIHHQNQHKNSLILHKKLQNLCQESYLKDLRF